MPPSPDPEVLRQLQSEIEAFLGSLAHSILVEDEERLFDLTASRWKLSVEYNKLLLEVWNQARSINRRVEAIAYRDRGRLGLFVRKPGGRETATLELRELEPVHGKSTGRKRSAARSTDPAARTAGRAQASGALLSALKREYPGWRFERVSNRSDREHSFSVWYPRGLARQGRTAWAFLALAEDEPLAAADAALAHGLIWLDWLRANAERVVISGLKLFLPAAAVEHSAHRATCLNFRAAGFEIYDWDSAHPQPVLVDLRDFGNVETHLAPRRRGEALLESNREMLRELLGDIFSRVELAADPTAAFLSLRVRGLEVARVEGQLAPRIYFGLEGSYRRMSDSDRGEFLEFVNRVFEIRQAASPDRSHEFYRLQSERWLESLLLGDIGKIDPALDARFVYPQVPAFSGMDRGVIDLLSVTRQGRLAVIELKVQEEINLPMQGLDYWLRVKWLAERGQFQPQGYFPGVELASEPPRLYLASPAFRFHSTTGQILKYLHPSIEIVQVGLNDQWREEVQVLFRRDARRGET